MIRSHLLAFKAATRPSTAVLSRSLVAPDGWPISLAMSMSEPCAVDPSSAMNSSGGYDTSTHQTSLPAVLTASGGLIAAPPPGVAEAPELLQAEKASAATASRPRARRTDVVMGMPPCARPGRRTEAPRVRRSRSSDRSLVAYARAPSAWGCEPGSVAFGTQPLAGLDPDRQAVLRRGQWARVPLVVDARRVVGQVEIEGVRPVVLRLDVEVAAGAVGLRPARGIEERHEQPFSVVAVERVARQAVPFATDLEREDAGPVRRPELAVRRGDLEVGGLATGIRLDRSPVEPERRVDRVVGEAGEGLPLGYGDRAPGAGVLEVVVLVR